MDKSKQQQMPTQNPKERSGNFKEVALGLSAESAYLEAARCLMCAEPKCVKGCPVGINIPAFIQEILNDKPSEALKIIHQSNMLPAVCGRVCPQERQCEAACVRGKIDQPVKIGYLERFAADNGTASGKEKLQENGKKVAVIGSGPAGLSCAAELRKNGYSVSVFEALHEFGGVLTYGIPEFRLPKTIVKEQIEGLRKLGVDFHKNAVVGRTLDVDELLKEEGFDAVYIATGAGYPRFLGIPGEDLNYVYSSNEFLTRINLMKAYKFPEVDTPVYVGKHVVVLGGGNTAMDAARCALRLGPEKVTLAYRRSKDEMPARVEEVHHAEEEGIEFAFLCSPKEIKGNESGAVSSIVLQKMKLSDPDESGRRRPVPIEGELDELKADSVIVAIGTRANPIISSSCPDLEVDERGYIKTDEDGRTSKARVYAGGDIVTGSATVILAMGAGKKTAGVIDKDIL